MANLLPENEKGKIEQELKGKKLTEKAGISLVIPTMDDEPEKNKSGKSLSFSERRKMKKEAKERERLRKIGETGSVKENLEREDVQEIEKEETKSDLFEEEDVSEKKTKPKPQMKSEPKTKSEPKMKEEKPKKEAKTASDILERNRKNLEKKESKKSSMPVADMNPKPTSNGDGFLGADVNLVPDSMRDSSSASPWVLSIAILLFVLAFWVIFGGITISNVNKAKARSQELSSRSLQLTNLINEYSEVKSAATTLQQQLKAVESLVDDHVYWTIILDNLEKITIPDVYYISINADKELSKVYIEAIAKDFASAARQLRAYEKATDIIDEVKMGEASIGNQPGAVLPVPVVHFMAELTLVDGVLTVLEPEMEEDTNNN